MANWQEEYPAVHRALAPEYRSLSRPQIEAIIGSTLGEGVGLDEAEGFFDDVGRALGGVAHAAAPFIQRALPGIASGAMGGAALGPLGMFGGALLGGLGSALGGGGGAHPAPPSPSGAPAGLPAAPSLGAPAPAGAIGQLLAALGSPTVQQALSSMMLGNAGARSVPAASGGQLPVAAITSLLGMLANRASAEWEATAGEASAEAFDEAAYHVSPELRAEAVFRQLAAPEALSAQFIRPAAEMDEAWIDELYDELEAELVYGAYETASDGRW
jgi:hypothetical protein